MSEDWDQALPGVIGLLRAGLPAPEAWRRAGVEVPGAPVGSLERAVHAADRLAARTGASLAAMLGAVATAAAEAHESHALRAAALAGPRLSARILAWLPVAGVALGALVDTRTVRVLLLTPLGWTLIAVAAALTAAGRVWTVRIVASAEGAGRGDDVLVLAAELLSAAIEAGAPVPVALAAVGDALGEPGLAAVAVGADARASPAADDAWAPLAHALAPAIAAGASPVPSLRAVAHARARRARTEAAIAAGELGVRVAMPLALCLLPAFVAVGLVPVLIAVVGGVAGPG